MRTLKPLLPGRCRCSVPFCGRTFKIEAPNERTICGKHWRLGNLKRRQLHTLAMKKYRRTGNDRYRWIAHLCWDAVLIQATERAAGITR